MYWRMPLDAPVCIRTQGGVRYGVRCREREEENSKNVSMQQAARCFLHAAYWCTRIHAPVCARREEERKRIQKKEDEERRKETAQILKSTLHHFGFIFIFKKADEERKKEAAQILKITLSDVFFW